MSYLYDKLKEALGGEVVTSNKNTVIRNWTPNNIKALIISRYYIVVVKHLGLNMGCAKQYDLDVNLVAQDLDELFRTNYGKPKLNSLLTKRSLSCLEEIYVDSMFQNYPQVLDLQGYMRELVSTMSRIRFFGYGEFPIGVNVAEYLSNAYRNAYNSGNYDYSIAKDSNRGAIRLEYRELNKKDWYTRYYLRPQFYQMDVERGNLAVHFRKFESDYAKCANKIAENDKLNAVREVIHDIVLRDDKVVLNSIDNLLTYLYKNKNDGVCSVALSATKKAIEESVKPVKGLTLDIIRKSTGWNDNYLFEAYSKKYKVLGNASDELDLDTLLKLHDEGEGFIRVKWVLDSICLRITEELLNKGKKDVVGMALMINRSKIPDGRFNSGYINNPNDTDSLEGFYSYLCDLVGCSEDELYK